MMSGHDFATYNPIDHSRKPDIDLLREEGFLWNPWTGHLLCVYNGEAAKLDPKGHIVLDSFFARGMERVAMVYLGGDVQPFVVAHGYDPLTGDWSHGSYCSNLDDAVAAMDDENPEIVASVQFMSTMVEDCLEAANRATSAENVDVVVDEVDTEELVQHMVNMAWDYVSNAVDDIRYKLEPAADTPAPATVTWLEHEEGLDAHDAGEVH